MSLRIIASYHRFISSPYTVAIAFVPLFIGYVRVPVRANKKKRRPDGGAGTSLAAAAPAAPAAGKAGGVASTLPPIPAGGKVGQTGPTLPPGSKKDPAGPKEGSLERPDSSSVVRSDSASDDKFVC